MTSLDQIIRVYKRAKSPTLFTKMIVEEALVRTWSNATIRKGTSILIRDYQPKKWVFVVGCFNSGTTLLQKMLSSHPEISGMPREGVRFTNLLSNLEEHGHHMIWSDDYSQYTEPSVTDDAALEQLKKDWGLFWQSESSVFLEKSVANTARISWLNRVFKNAYFIGIHRNGYCVCEGLRRRAEPPDWYRKKSGSKQYTYESVAKQWVVANELMLENLENMPNAKIIRFEDLVANPLSAVKSCTDFLQLNTECFSLSGDTLSASKRRFKIHDPNPASLDRLGVTGQRELVSSLSPMMQRLGY